LENGESIQNVENSIAILDERLSAQGEEQARVESSVCDVIALVFETKETIEKHQIETDERFESLDERIKYLEDDTDEKRDVLESRMYSGEEVSTQLDGIKLDVVRVKSDIQALQRDRFENMNTTSSVDGGAIGPLKANYCALALETIERDRSEMGKELLSTVWVHLCLVKQEKRDTADAMFILGREEQHNVLMGREPIRLDDLFVEGRKRVLIQGRAGVGKSSLMKYVCQQWAMGLLFCEYDAVVLIPLFDIKHLLNGVSDWEIVLKEVLPKGVDIFAFWKWAQLDTSNVLWILDGVDEVASSSSPLLKKLLSNKQFLSRALISTRPETKVKHLVDFELCVEVQGFSKEDAIKFVCCYFNIRAPLSSAEGNLSKLAGLIQIDDLRPEQAKADMIRAGCFILSIIESNALVGDLVRTPMNLELVCYAGEDLKNSPRLVDIYSLVLKKMTRRWRDKGHQCILDDDQLVPILARVAWDSMSENVGFIERSAVRTQIVNLNKIDQLGLNAKEQLDCVEFVLGCGPWKAVGDDRYFWAHFTFQDYLAAMYVCEHMVQDCVTEALRDSMDIKVTHSHINERKISEFQVESDGCSVSLDLTKSRWSDVFYNFVCGIASAKSVRNQVVLNAMKGIISQRVALLESENLHNFRNLAYEIGDFVIGCVIDDESGSLFKVLTELKLDVAAASFLLTCAVKQGRADIVKILLFKHADANVGIRDASFGGFEEILRMLLEKRADPNKGLHDAICGGYPKIVKLLLENGAQANYGVASAADIGNESILKMLLAAGGDASKGLRCAVKNKHAGIVQLLLDNGANANEGLSAASGMGDLVTFRLLLDHGATNALERCCTRTAAFNGHFELVQELLVNGAVPGDMICAAAEGGHVALVQLLLDVGANPSLGLDGAAAGGHEAIVNLLLENGAIPDEGIHNAAYHGHDGIVKLLIGRGADLDRGFEGAVGGGEESLMEFFLKQGANPSCGIKTAVARRDCSLIRKLLELGADPLIGIENVERVRNEPFFGGMNWDAISALFLNELEKRQRQRG
jgi:ankyrin repeat protein